MICKTGSSWMLAFALLALLPASFVYAQRSLNPSRDRGVPAGYRSSGRLASAPRHERVVSETIVDGTVLESPEFIEPMPSPGFGGGCGSCGQHECGGYGCGLRDRLRCYWLRMPRLSNALQNMQYSVGVEGFMSPRSLSPPTRGQDGSFGFQEGINWGTPFPFFDRFGIATQLGIRLTQSNFSGASFTADNRSQVFLTGGFFRRADCGLQAGIVLDYLQDEWYVEMDVAQARFELSWVGDCGREFGFMGTSALDGDTNTATTVDATGRVVSSSETWDPVDIYALFYRHHIDDCTGANGRAFVGVSGEQDALLGADFTLPLSDCWALQGGFSYLIPKDTNNQFGSISEDWAVGFNLVWHPAGFSNPARRYLQPLFDVAGNRNLFITR